MRRRAWTRMSLRVVLAIATSCAAVSCGKRSEPASGRNAVVADSASLAGPSLFELAFPLTDMNGRTRHLVEFRGQPFVASMIYTHCTSVCPRVTADLQALDRSLGPAVRSHTRFVLFSLDPERDTPEALRAFARERSLDTTRWTLLAAGPDDMRTLAAILDVRFRPDAAGEIAHTAVMAVVDRNGVIRHRQAGLTGESSALAAAVRAVE